MIGIHAAFLGPLLDRGVGIPTWTEGIDRLEIAVEVAVAANPYLRSRGTARSLDERV